MYIDFEEIKANVSIEDAIGKLNLKMARNGKQFRSPCPVCKSGGDRALVATPEKKAFYCFAAQKGGDVIAFVAHIKGCGQKEAAQFLAGDPVPPEKEKEEAPACDGFKPLEYLQIDHEAVAALGFDADVAEAVGLGYAPRGVMRGTVAVPLRLENGRLIGYVGITDAKLPSSFKL